MTNDMEEGVYKQFLSNRSISNVYFTFPISCLMSILEKLFRPVVLSRIELKLLNSTLCDPLVSKKL